MKLSTGYKTDKGCFDRVSILLLYFFKNDITGGFSYFFEGISLVQSSFNFSILEKRLSIDWVRLLIPVISFKTTSDLGLSVSDCSDCDLQKLIFGGLRKDSYWFFRLILGLKNQTLDYGLLTDRLSCCKESLLSLNIQFRLYY